MAYACQGARADGPPSRPPGAGRRVLHHMAYIALFLCLLAFSSCGAAATARQHTPDTAGATPVALTPTELAANPLDVVATPKRLLIPAIGVNASIESLGILPNGDMATPTREPWQDVGWYNQGPLPGEQGSAVIDGHLDRPEGYPAIFWRLRAMHVNDEVRISESDGSVLRFRVTRVAAYAPQEAPLQDIFGNQSGRYLNLITCAGDWIPSEQQTTLRLVVYTTLIGV